MPEEKDPLDETTTEETTAEETTVEETGAEGGEAAEEGADLLGQAQGKKGAAPDVNERVVEALDKISQRLSQPGGMTAEQTEAAWAKLEEQSGMSRQQLQFMDQQGRKTSLLANLETNKELGKMKGEKVFMGVEDSDELLATLEKEMAAMPPEIAGNPKAWEDAAYLVLGKHAKKGGVKMKTGEGAGGNGQRKIVGGAGSTTRGAAGGSSTKTPPKKYEPFEQHVIDRQFGGNAQEYEKYRGKTSIDNDVKIVAGSGAGAADKELERLTQGNT